MDTVNTLVFRNLSDGTDVVVVVERLLVAGFTGRDAEAVAHHVSELADIGVPVPENTPVLFQPPPKLVRQTPALPVVCDNTSGEVEPVIVKWDDRLYLTIGSDHTDRTLETSDLAASKAACIHPIGLTCIALDDVEDWDSLTLTSAVDGGMTEYQRGRIDVLLPAETIIEFVAREAGDLRNGDVVFLGTISTIGNIRPSKDFTASITNGTWSLDLHYSVVDMSSRGGAPLDKPELEFFAVEDIEWTLIPGGVDGQSERLLSVDTSTGIATRMLRFEPGTDTTVLGVLRHDFWEEVYILEGELHDLTLDKVFRAGTYASRPPGMPHGPWKSASGCVTFEARYPVV